MGNAVKVYSVTGQEVKSIVLDGSGVQEVRIEQKGIYFVSLVNHNGLVKTLKLINS